LNVVVQDHTGHRLEGIFEPAPTGFNFFEVVLQCLRG